MQTIYQLREWRQRGDDNIEDYTGAGNTAPRKDNAS